jgi:WD repeat-containing protein 23
VQLVFDIDGDRPTLSIDAHENDVNAVCWADEASKHVLCSASDDGYVKVWDRRSLSSGKPSGVLVGHTEGITSVSAKGWFDPLFVRAALPGPASDFGTDTVHFAGDGRYILSNGKDQSCRLWDLRSMASSSVCDAVPDAAEKWGTGFDYRQEIYAKPRYQKAAGDCSVMVSQVYIPSSGPGRMLIVA